MSNSNFAPPAFISKRSMFVTLLAMASLIMSIFSVFSGIATEVTFLSGIQSVIVNTQNFPANLYGENIEKHVFWLVDKVVLLNRISIIFSVVMIIPSWGLLKRKKWGLMSFILLLIITSIIILIASIWGIKEMNMLLTPEITAAGSALMQDDIIQRLVLMVNVGLVLIPGTIILFNLWFIWKLTRPNILAEFA